MIETRSFKKCCYFFPNNYKISKLSNNSTVPRFVTKKWVEVNDLSSGQYYVYKIITFRTSMLRSDLCDYSDAYIVVKGTIGLLAAAANENDEVENDVTLKMFHLDHAFQK